MKKVYDVTNQKFNKLTAIKFGKRKNKMTYWWFQCDCNGPNSYKLINVAAVKGGATVSCGCVLNKSKNSLKHGLVRHPLYSIWRGIKKRCYNPKCNGYKNYGGRGITMCDEWLNNFKSFYDWAMKNGYTKNLTIDRINNNLGYFPENCKWSTAQQQGVHKRNNILFNYNDKNQTISEWSREFKINSTQLYYYYYNNKLKEFLDKRCYY